MSTLCWPRAAGLGWTTNSARTLPFRLHSSSRRCACWGAKAFFAFLVGVLAPSTVVGVVRPFRAGVGGLAELTAPFAIRGEHKLRLGGCELPLGLEWGDGDEAGGRGVWRDDEHPGGDAMQTGADASGLACGNTMRVGEGESAVLHSPAWPMVMSRGGERREEGCSSGAGGDGEPGGCGGGGITPRTPQALSKTPSRTTGRHWGGGGRPHPVGSSAVPALPHVVQ
ncbi:hypothetical protein B0H11DRAFT_1940955 [Mycena galericulata]|nr:hypothetical protein B0H11DRAFT_1940955 [Mycena galericulata]